MREWRSGTCCGCSSAARTCCMLRSLRPVRRAAPESSTGAGRGSRERGCRRRGRRAPRPARRQRRRGCACAGRPARPPRWTRRARARPSSRGARACAAGLLPPRRPPGGPAARGPGRVSAARGVPSGACKVRRLSNMHTPAADAVGASSAFRPRGMPSWARSVRAPPGAHQHRRGRRGLARRCVQRLPAWRRCAARGGARGARRRRCGRALGPPGGQRLRWLGRRRLGGRGAGAAALGLAGRLVRCLLAPHRQARLGPDSASGGRQITQTQARHGEARSGALTGCHPGGTLQEQTRLRILTQQDQEEGRRRGARTQQVRGRRAPLRGRLALARRQAARAAAGAAGARPPPASQAAGRAGAPGQRGSGAAGSRSRRHRSGARSRRRACPPVRPRRRPAEEPRGAQHLHVRPATPQVRGHAATCQDPVVVRLRAPLLSR